MKYGKLTRRPLWDPVAVWNTINCKITQNENTANVKEPHVRFTKNSYLNQMRLHLFGEKMALNIQHNILKIEHWNETSAVLVGLSETLDGVLFVEIVQELTEFTVRHQSVLLPAEVQLDERWVHVKRYPLVEFGFGYHLSELR